MRNYKIWTPQELELLKKLCEGISSFKELREKIKDTFPGRFWHSIRSKARGDRLIKIKKDPKETKEVVADLALDSDVLDAMGKELPKERKFSDPEVIEVNKDAWERPGERVGFISGIYYKSEGYRAGLIKRAIKKLTEEGVHFYALDGGLVNKHAMKSNLKKFLQNFPKAMAGEATNHFLDECARELASVIPRIKKPGPNKEFVRLYIMTSLPYDGPFGEEIAIRLQALRREDIRHYKQGGDRLEIKSHNNNQGQGKNNRNIWAISPRKQRLPTKYYSGAAEREIDDKRGQTTQLPPSLWVVGTLASNVHKPDGERPEPYITIGDLHRLEEVTVAENQISITVLEYAPGNTRFVRVWNLKDMVAREREFITGIKSGASDLHKKIVDAIRKHGALTSGLLEEQLAVDRQTLEKEITFLVEEQKSPRRTWPGLFYDPSSQRYDFHLDWLQENLVYPAEKDSLSEDIFLFFGCLHAGYTTTDYRFIVEEMPGIILAHKVKIWVGLGDFIAGLQHDYLHTGEVFGDLNNTDQERFAAELVGTVIIKVFKQRLEEALSKRQDKSAISQEEAENLIRESLVKFLYIPGNHDIWQEREGSTPLVVFKDGLINLLSQNIIKILVPQQFPAIDIFKILNEKVVGFSDFDAVCQFPSGLNLGMQHPHLSRTKTTSLRAQEALDSSDCKIVGMANFHTAIVVNKWYPDRGQCVAVQAGTMVQFTRFERRKLKSKVDFGPIFLRVLSRHGKIEMTESAYFNQRLIQEPLPKWTNLEELKRKLKIFCIPQ